MPRVALRGIRKRFGETEALSGAELELEPAEVHALLGENGAGKTTLVRVLYGLVRADAGTVEIEGRACEIRGPRHALELGIGLVHQEFMGVPALSVAENLLLGEAGSLLLGRQAARARAGALLAEYGLDLDPDAPAGSLGVAQKQRLEIVRALARGARLLVLDEPTAVLAPSEVDSLLGLLARLRDDGRTVVFISHRLEEVSQVCDRVTVLRAGATVATGPVAGVEAGELARFMVGDALPPPGRPAGAERRGVALRLRALRASGLGPLDLELQSGEVFAIAGIDGNGQGSLEEVLAAVEPLAGGALEVVSGPLAVISGDRQHTGLVLDLSLEENLLLRDAGKGGRAPAFRRGLLQRREQRRLAEQAIERLDIRAEPSSRVRTLSGGNQQKVCIARALHADPGVLVAVNPTRGLDLSSSAFVREELREQARAGVAILLLSTDLDEVLELGDRVAVLFRGRLEAIEPGGASRERIGALMLGQSAA